MKRSPILIRIPLACLPRVRKGLLRLLGPGVRPEWRWLCTLGTVVVGCGLAGMNAIAAYAIEESAIWEQIPHLPDYRLLNPEAEIDPAVVLTEAVILQDQLTEPSLWWIGGQYGGKILDTWIAYTGADGTPRRIDLIVNQSAWSNVEFTYMNRYAFVTHFGQAAQSFGYQLRIFNRNTDEPDLLAAYLCEVSPLPSDDGLPHAQPSDCELFIDPGIGYEGVSPTSRPFGGF